MIRVLKVIGMVGIAITFINCGKSNIYKNRVNGNPAQPAPERRVLFKDNCQIKYDEGTDLDSFPTDPDFKPSYFSKNIPLGYMKALMTTSGRTTVKLIKSTKVNMFKVVPKDNLSECQYFRELDLPPTSLLAKFNEVAQPNGSKGTTVGLYLPDFLKTEISDLAQIGPSIMVSVDTNRWTAVHEFMHHMFFSQLGANELSDSKLKEQLIEKNKTVNTYYSRYTEGGKIEDLALALENQIEVAKISEKLMSRFHLEEMVIEKFLSDAYSRGELKYVPEIDRTNAAWYISANAEKAKDKYLKVQRSLHVLLDLADSQSDQTSLSKSIIQAQLTDQEISRRIKDLSPFLPQSKSEDETHSLEIRYTEDNSERAQAPALPVFDSCSRIHELDSIDFPQLGDF